MSLLADNHPQGDMSGSCLDATLPAMKEFKVESRPWRSVRKKVSQRWAGSGALGDGSGKGDLNLVDSRVRCPSSSSATIAGGTGCQWRIPVEFRVTFKHSRWDRLILRRIRFRRWTD